VSVGEINTCGIVMGNLVGGNLEDRCTNAYKVQRM